MLILLYALPLRLITIFAPFFCGLPGGTIIVNCKSTPCKQLIAWDLVEKNAVCGLVSAIIRSGWQMKLCIKILGCTIIKFGGPMIQIIVHT